MPVIVLICGPPGSGKDTLAAGLSTALTSHSIRVVRLAFADHLKTLTHAAFGLPLDPRHYESQKDVPLPEFFGATPRASYIHFSEQVMKPLYGPQFFGEMWVRKARTRILHPPFGVPILFAVPDSGFRGEAAAVVEAFGSSHLLLLRLHRAGHTYANDSRDYIDLADLGVPAVDIDCPEGDPMAVVAGAINAMTDRWPDVIPPLSRLSSALWDGHTAVR